MAKLPLNSGTTNGAQLQAEWDFKYISCHGYINNRIFVVPEKTYIYFTTKAGEFATIEEQAEIHNFIYNLLDSSEKWWNNIYKAMKDKGLFHEQVYNPRVTPGPVNNAAQKRAFYAPGDIIQDLNLVFKNNAVKPIFPMGAFQIPIRSSLKEAIDTFNENGGKVVDATTDSTYFNNDINLFRARIFGQNIKEWTLYDAIENLGSFGSKKRLIVVDACRVPTSVKSLANMSKESVLAERRLSRSLSVSGRSYEEGAACVLPPSVHTINRSSLLHVKKVLNPPPLPGTPQDALLKAINKLLDGLYDEGVRKPASSDLLSTVLAKAAAAERPIRGGKRKTKKQLRKKRSTRRR